MFAIDPHAHTYEQPLVQSLLSLREDCLYCILIPMMESAYLNMSIKDTPTETYEIITPPLPIRRVDSSTQTTGIFKSTPVFTLSKTAYTQTVPVSLAIPYNEICKFNDQFKRDGAYQFCSLILLIILCISIFAVIFMLHSRV